MARLCFALSTLLALLACGCGESGEASNAGGSSASGGTGGATGGSAGTSSGAGAEGGVECPDPAVLAPGEVCIEAVEGRVVDGDGTPLNDVLLTVCGARQCSPGFSGADGRFRVDVGFPLVLRDYSTLPHGRPTHTSFYFQLPLDATGPLIQVGDLTMLELPAMGPELVVKTDNAGAPAQSVTSGEVTLEVAEGVRVSLDVEDVVEGAAGKQFRVLEVPAEQHAKFLRSGSDAFGLYAFMPFEAGFDVAATLEPATARVSFPNRTALAPGAAVDVLALGTYQYPKWVSPAAFESVASGTVSGDGTRIELDPGQGLRYLTWVALREKP